MTKKTCVVVIPIHDASPSPYELISFQQCFRILSNHSIKIVAPKGLTLHKYKEVVSNFETVFIDPIWQSTLIKYNQLKLSLFFYDLFKDFEFLLTYELDAFVFKDDLEYWCKQGYDYIGAPWFEGFGVTETNTNLIGVGNSGFSLRKISAMQRIIKFMYYKNPEDFKYGRLNLIKGYLKMPLKWLRTFVDNNYKISQNGQVHEDLLIGLIANYFNGFNIAPISEAVKFSFEVNPEYLFELNNSKLPTGCHAWWKYDLNFWKPHIEKFGYIL
jgi:hypothetical protein